MLLRINQKKLHSTLLFLLIFLLIFLCNIFINAQIQRCPIISSIIPASRALTAPANAEAYYSANAAESKNNIVTTLTITASAGPGGTISPSGTITIPFGGDQDFSITPNTGYHISNVIVSGYSVGAVSSYSFVGVSSNQTISASFALNTYTVTASADNGGTISPSSQTVTHGGTATFTVTPNTGYYICGSSGGTLSGNTLTVSNVTSNRSVSVSFCLLGYSISGHVRDNNNVGIQGVTITLPDNEWSTTTTTDATGYYGIEVPYGWVGFVSASKTGYTISPSSTEVFTVTSNTVVDFSASSTIYIITASAGSGGSISPGGSITVTSGSSKSFTIAPNTCYNISNVIVGSVSQGAISSYTFSNITADHSIIAYFTPLVPGTPTLSSPSSGSTGVGLSQVLSWNSSSCADSYTLQVSNSSSFSTTLVNTSTTSLSYNLSGLQNNTTYYWRVSASNSTGTSSWSSTRSFTTIIAAPILSSPANNSTGVSINPTLSWNSVSGAVEYTWQVATDNNFSTIVCNGWYQTLSTSSCHLDYNTLYYWRVKATNSQGTCGPWSDYRSFRTMMAPPAQPTLSSPSNGSVGVSISPVLSWISSSYADSYTLQVSTSSSFSTTLVNTSTTGLSYNLSGLQNNTAYYWRVSASNSAGTSSWSSTRNFTTIIGPPALSSPTNGSEGISTSPTLICNTLPGAIEYRFELSSDPNFAADVRQYTSQSTSAPFNGLNNYTTYYWRVKVWDSGARQSGWSEVWSFTTIIGPPTLSSPSDGSEGISTSPTLVCNSELGALEYRFELSSDPNFVADVHNYQSQSTSASFNGLDNYITYYWRVKVWDSDARQSNWSEVWYFKTIIGPPTLSSPTNGSGGVSTSPTLICNTLPGAIECRFELSSDPNFAADVRQYTSQSTSASFNGLDNYTTYYWRVKVWDSDARQSGWSEVWSFRTMMAPPAQPTLSSPANNSIGVSINPTLAWNSASDAVEYTWQTSTNNNFDTLVCNGSDQTLSTSSCHLDYNTLYYWRVKATNAEGTYGLWSDVWNFTTEAPPPPILSVSPDTLHFTYTGGTNTVTVSNQGYGNMDWASSKSLDWGDILSGNSGTNSGSITFSCSQNTGSQRSGTLTVTAQGALGSPKTIVIEQYAAPNLLNPDKTTLNFTYSGGADTITANGSWQTPTSIMLNDVPSWIQTSVNGNKIIVTVGANTGSAKNDSFAVSAANANDTVFVSVNQTAEPPLAVSITNVYPPSNTTHAPDSVTITFTTTKAGIAKFFADEIVTDSIQVDTTSVNLYSYKHLVAGIHELKVTVTNSSETSSDSVNYFIGEKLDITRITPPSPAFLPDTVKMYFMRNFSGTYSIYDNETLKTTASANNGKFVYPFVNLTPGMHILKVVSGTHTDTIHYRVTASPTVVITDVQPTSNSIPAPDSLTIFFDTNKEGKAKFYINSSAVDSVQVQLGSNSYTYNKLEAGNLQLSVSVTYTSPLGYTGTGVDTISYTLNKSLKILADMIRPQSPAVVPDTVHLYFKKNFTGVYNIFDNNSLVYSSNSSPGVVYYSFVKPEVGIHEYKVVSDLLSDSLIYVVKPRPIKNLAYKYDNLGNITEINADTNFVFKYAYDAESRLKEVRSKAPNSSETLDAGYSYNSADQQTTFQPSSLQLVTCNYDTLRGWLTSIIYTGNLFSENLSYNSNGNVNTQTIHNTGNGSWSDYIYTFTYDDMNRLTYANSTLPIASENYTYNMDGRFETKVRTGKYMDYDYWSGTNRLFKVTTNGSEVTGYGYDAKGNIYGGYGILRNYNYQNLPLEMFNADNETYKYTYNNSGERIRKVNSDTGEGDYYLRDYLGRELVIYDNLTDEPKEANIFGSGLVGKIEVVNGVDSRSYYLKDHLGSIRCVLNANGSILNAQDFYPYGETIREYNGTSNKYMFTEKERDSESTYDYFGARYYDSNLGMWLQVDPMSEMNMGWSSYNYVKDNPNIKIDPNGLWDVTIHLTQNREKYRGIAIVTDRSGNEVFRFTVRAEGIGGKNRMKEYSDTPTGIYDIPDKNPWRESGKDRAAYGPNDRLVMIPESGEIFDSGRDLIRIHGGRQEVYYEKSKEWKPVDNPELKKTKGCIKAYDEDMKKLKEKTDELQKNDAKEIPGKVIINNDLSEN